MTTWTANELDHLDREMERRQREEDFAKAHTEYMAQYDTQPQSHFGCTGACQEGRPCDCAPDVEPTGHERKPSSWPLRLYMRIKGMR